MYKLVYYFKQTEGLASTGEVQEWDRVYQRGEAFRLRKNALNYLMGKKEIYKDLGFEIITRVGGIHCFKSEKTAQGERKFTDLLIKVEKA